jgi:hypothetical protein
MSSKNKATQEKVLLRKIACSIEKDKVKHNSTNFDVVKILLPQDQIESMLNLLTLFRDQFRDLIECDNQLKSLVAELKIGGLKPNEVSFEKQFENVRMDIVKAEKMLERCHLGVVMAKDVYLNWKSIESQLGRLAHALSKSFAEGLMLFANS